jgi:hypothetical protein
VFQRIVGARNAGTWLRLTVGEVQLLASIIEDADR